MGCGAAFSHSAYGVSTSPCRAGDGGQAAVASTRSAQKGKQSCGGGGTEVRFEDNFSRRKWEFEGGKQWLPCDPDEESFLDLLVANAELSGTYTAKGCTYSVDFELEIRTNLQTKSVQKIRCKPKQVVGIAPPPLPELPDGHLTGSQLQWRLKSGKWVDFEEEENDALLVAHLLEKRQSKRYSARGFEYEMNFTHLSLTNISSGKVHEVRIAPSGSHSEEQIPFQFAFQSFNPVQAKALEDAAISRNVENSSKPKSSELPGQHRQQRGRGRQTAHVPAPSKSDRPCRPARELGARAANQVPWANASVPSSVRLEVDSLEDEESRKCAQKLVNDMAQKLGAGLVVRKKTFKTMQLNWHPDKNPQQESLATDVFQVMQVAKLWFLKP